MFLLKLKPWTVWLVAWAILSVAVVGADFKSRSNDSKFYNRLVEQLAAKPWHQMLAPKWGDNFYGHPPDDYIRDHFSGHLWPGVVLAKMGFPSEHALTILQLIYQILLFYLFANFLQQMGFSTLAGYCSFVFLQMIPLAFTHQLRANHEMAMTLFMTLALYCQYRSAAQRSIKWALLSYFCVIEVLLIKGLSVIVMLPMIGLWQLLVSPRRGMHRLFTALSHSAVAALAVVLTIYIYDQVYFSVTGLDFFKEYWRVQIAERSLDLGSQYPWLIQKMNNFLYYGPKVIWYSAPWSLWALWHLVRTKGPSFWRFWQFQKHSLAALNQQKFRLAFLGSILIFVLIFSYSNRLASRYILPSFYWAAVISYASMIELGWFPKSWQQFLIYHQQRIKYAGALLWLAMGLAHLLIAQVRGPGLHGD